MPPPEGQFPPPGWTISKANLYGVDEDFDLEARRVEIDPSRWGERWMTDHVAGHFFLGHVPGAGGSFTPEQEDQADTYARGRRVSYVPFDDDDATEPFPAFTMERA